MLDIVGHIEFTAIHKDSYWYFYIPSLQEKSFTVEGDLRGPDINDVVAIALHSITDEPSTYLRERGWVVEQLGHEEFRLTPPPNRGYSFSFKSPPTAYIGA